jgi:hypothetical protein
VGADPVDHLGQPVREAGGRRLPGSDGVPPVAFGVPTGVDAEVVGADVRGGVDQWQEFLGRRIAQQGVHVVVENDRHPVVRRTSVTDRAALPGEGGEHTVPVCPGDERDGHCGE